MSPDKSLSCAFRAHENACQNMAYAFGEGLHGIGAEDNTFAIF